MLNSLKIFRFLSVSLFLILGNKGQSCPEFIEKMKTTYLGEKNFCQVYDEYLQTLDSLKQEHLEDSNRFADFIAPRFINWPDWEQAKQAANFNPFIVYKPAPLTWINWERGQNFMLEKASQNSSNQIISPITLDWILKIHTLMLKGLSSEAGIIRKSTEVGLGGIDRKWALTKSQTENLLNNGGLKSSVNPNQNLYTWKPTICMDQMDKAKVAVIEEKIKNDQAWFIEAEWPKVSNSDFFKTEGEPKQCGYILYAPGSEVQADLEDWLNTLNKQTSLWGSNETYEDPILMLARSQRWFVGIHPFEDGNGRTIRTLVDLYLLSLGLPPPVFKEMDDDIYLSESEWAKELGDGILRSLSIVKRCALKPQAAGCNRVPQIKNTELTQ
jgi:hypothetical protein